MSLNKEITMFEERKYYVCLTENCIYKNWKVCYSKASPDNPSCNECKVEYDTKRKSRKNDRKREY